MTDDIKAQINAITDVPPLVQFLKAASSAIPVTGDVQPIGTTLPVLRQESPTSSAIDKADEATARLARVANSRPITDDYEAEIAARYRNSDPLTKYDAHKAALEEQNPEEKNCTNKFTSEIVDAAGQSEPVQAVLATGTALKTYLEIMDQRIEVMKRRAETLNALLPLAVGEKEKSDITLEIQEHAPKQIEVKAARDAYEARLKALEKKLSKVTMRINKPVPRKKPLIVGPAWLYPTTYGLYTIDRVFTNLAKNIFSSVTLLKTRERIFIAGILNIESEMLRNIGDMPSRLTTNFHPEQLDKWVQSAERWFDRLGTRGKSKSTTPDSHLVASPVRVQTPRVESAPPKLEP